MKEALCLYKPCTVNTKVYNGNRQCLLDTYTHFTIYSDGFFGLFKRMSKVEEGNDYAKRMREEMCKLKTCFLLFGISCLNLKYADAVLCDLIGWIFM